jgi:hypothetical protein
LRFKGERIGYATRARWNCDGCEDELKITASLYKTEGGKVVVGFETYYETEKRFDSREAYVSDTLEELAEQLYGWDYDILATLFQHTEVGDKFVEEVDSADSPE